jgi:hypothetical protein
MGVGRRVKNFLLTMQEVGGKIQNGVSELGETCDHGVGGAVLRVLAFMGQRIGSRGRGLTRETTRSAQKVGFFRERKN